MAVETIYKTKNESGRYSCGDIGITTEEWYGLLCNDKAEPYIDTLLAFMREPQHCGTCSAIAQKYNCPAQHYNAKVTNFAKWVQKKLGRFRVIGTDGNDTFWAIVMQEGWDTKQGFKWQLRNELVSALRVYLMEDLIDRFRNGSPFYGYDEAYKWHLIDDAEGASSIEIVKKMMGKNIIDNMRVDSVLKMLCESKEHELKTCIDNLLDETIVLDNRIANFKSKMRALCPQSYTVCANDERTVASILTCRYPEKYTFYMDKVYKLIWQYFGYEHKSAGEKYSHFMSIIHKFTEDFGKEVQNIIKDEISIYRNKPEILAVQTLFWCMQEYMNNQLKSDMRFTWIPYFKEFAEKLVKFRHDRQPLLKSIYNKRDELYASYLHDEGGLNDLCSDIDPFSVFGLFNRGIRYENRINSTKVFKELLDISSDIPTDFEGVPIMNNQKSYFFGYKSRRDRKDIDNLWSLFEKLIGNEDIEAIYNTVIKQYGINVNITMALFWIRPNDFLALDSTNREYLKSQYNIDLPRKAPVYEEYMELINDIKKQMANNTIKEKTFYELSANANNNGREDSESDSYTWYDSVVDTLRRRKNIVLYGAPGTGKTFSIPEIAVRLCDDSDYTRDELMKRYEQLKHEKRIAFTTFHQSMDYEDWIEGLKPVCENNQVTYDIEKGIFKQLCEEAERPIVKDKHIGIADDAVVWKVSLCGTGDNEVRTECMENSHIRIGWDDYGPVISEETDWSIYDGEGKRILSAFVYDMKVGDVIMSCYSNQTIDAIGIVTGDYEYDDSFIHYKRVRKVNWILKGINENIVELNDGKTMTLGTVYRLNAITLDKVKSILEKYEKPTTMADNNQPYVMVIDELNRGNVSKIFGELITLLETDKRKGQKNAESVILPYSKKPFMIPNNVFIIATMNTADRSLGTLDYAIRRRFAFVACKPYALSEEEVNGFDEELFKDVSSLFISNYSEYEESGWDQSFKLVPADTLSSEYHPEDVWIGQSYFIMTDDDGVDITSDRLLYEIIPLLEEYVRDGVLTEDANETIERLYQKAVE